MPLYIPTVANAPPFVCPAPKVHDGDTLRCAGGPSMRLARIDAPELPGSPVCRRRRGAPVNCNAAAARRSTVALRRMANLGVLRCRVVDASPSWRGFQASDRYGRPVVRCTVNGRDVGAEQLRGGFAVPWPPGRLYPKVMPSPLESSWRE